MSGCQYLYTVDTIGLFNKSVTFDYYNLIVRMSVTSLYSLAQQDLQDVLGNLGEVRLPHGVL